MLSSDAVSTRAPSGENTAEQTVSSWPRRTRSSWPEAASHSRAVLSSDAVSTRAPSGENTAERTRPSWPRRTLQLLAGGGVPEPGGVVPDAVSTRAPSGENTAEVDRSLVAAQNLPLSLGQCRLVERRGGRGERSVVANQLDPVQGLEPEEHRGHGVAGLVLLLGELGQP